MHRAAAPLMEICGALVLIRNSWSVSGRLHHPVCADAATNPPPP